MFSFGDMLTLGVLILVIFGPDRMPALARKAGTMLAKARDTVRLLRDDLGDDYKEVLAPIEDVRKSLREARAEIRGIATDVAHQVTGAIDDATTDVSSIAAQASDSVDESLAAARNAISIEKPVSDGGPTDLVATGEVQDVDADGAEAGSRDDVSSGDAVDQGSSD